MEKQNLYGGPTTIWILILMLEAIGVFYNIMRTQIDFFQVDTTIWRTDWRKGKIKVGKISTSDRQKMMAA